MPSPAPTPALVKLEHNTQVEPGDTVYQVVRCGVGIEHVKHKPYKVVRVERQACLCESDNNPRPIKLHFKTLMIEPKPEQARPPLSLVAEPVVDEDDALLSWMDMGKELVEDLDHQAKDLEEEKAIEAETLAERMAEHQLAITHLESELKAAHQAKERTRLEHKEVIDSLDHQVQALHTKRDKVLKALAASK